MVGNAKIPEVVKVNNYQNFSLNLLSKMFVLTEIIDCIFLLFSKILRPVLCISPLY
jgi:hypothetical protein